MSKLSTKRKKLALTSVIASLVALSVLAIAATIGLSSSITSASGSATGAAFIIDNAASGNNVWVYARASDGSLSLVGPIATNGLGTGSGLGSQGALALTPDGHWLLVVDAGSNEISVFAVHGTTLTFAGKASSQGSDPVSLTINRNLVYVLDASGTGNIAGFWLSSTGILTYISGSNRPLSGQASPSPEEIGFNPDGNVLLVTEKATNTIDVYTVNSAGVASAPTSVPSVGSGPYAFVYTDHNQLLLSEAATGTLTSYVVSDNGQLRVISGAIPTFGLAPCWIVVTNEGQFVYTANAHGGTISSFSVSRTGGLTLFSSIAAHTTIPALDMAFSRNSQFLYVRNGNAITGYRVFEDGSIVSITSASGTPSSAAGLVAV